MALTKRPVAIGHKDIMSQAQETRGLQLVDLSGVETTSSFSIVA